VPVDTFYNPSPHLQRTAETIATATETTTADPNTEQGNAHQTDHATATGNAIAKASATATTKRDTKPN